MNLNDMDRAHEIFERIKTQGISAIDAFIADRKAEELFLDFKRSSDDGRGSKLSGDDRKNFAKAISGFGNSEGGVIVWGVDCSRDFDGADVAKTTVPITNPKRFASLLQGVISGCTIPPHSGVLNEAIETDDGKGYVISLIPASDATPHQSVVTKQYYIRAGSDFVPTPHDVLAGMFGRRPQPHVFNSFLLAIPELRGEKIHITIGLVIHNRGPGIARDIFSTIQVESVPGSKCGISFDPPSRELWVASFVSIHQLSQISTQGYRLPPGATIYATVINIDLAPPFNKELRIVGQVGASESRRYDFNIKANNETLTRQYDVFLSKIAAGNFPNNERKDIVRDIFSTRFD